MAQSRLRKLAAYLRPHWKEVALGILALLIVNAMGVYIPLLIRNAIDELQKQFNFDRVWHYALLVLVLATVMWVIRVASRLFLFGVGRQVEFDLKQKIFQHLLTLEPAYFSTGLPAMWIISGVWWDLRC
jgi:ATP-binding cassette, subfamily B, multidrug efflux pump